MNSEIGLSLRFLKLVVKIMHLCIKCGNMEPQNVFVCPLVGELPDGPLSKRCSDLSVILSFLEINSYSKHAFVFGFSASELCSSDSPCYLMLLYCKVIHPCITTNNLLSFYTHDQF